MSQYHNYNCKNLPKTGNNDITHKTMQILYLDIWPMLLSGHVPHREAIQVTCFGISKTMCVPVRNLFYRTKLTYHLLLIGFFHKLILMQGVAHNMLHLDSSTTGITLSWYTPVSNLLPMTIDAELNIQFPLAIDH